MSKPRKSFSGCFCSSTLSQHALTSAIKKGEKAETLKELVRHVKDIDTALPFAYHDACHLLFHCFLEQGLTPLELAINKRSDSVVNLLLETGADTEQSSKAEWTPLIRACNHGCLDVVKQLVEHGADMTARTRDGLTCLALALKKEHVSVVSYLVEQESCPIDNIEEDGRTLLHNVVLWNDSNIITKLINKGVDVNAQTHEGETPLFLAAQYLCQDSLRLLLESKADPDICTKEDGKNPVFIALTRKFTTGLEMLLEFKADPNICPKNGESPFLRAMSQNSSESSRMLVTAGVETAQKLDNDRNPLLIACRAGSLKDVQLLVEHGADLGTRTPDGLTCLFVSIKNKHIGVVSYLLEQESCPVDDIDEDGCTLLHHVVLLNDPDATSKLIKKGVDINAQNQDGETPLFLATKHNHPASLKVLLKFGADPNVSTINGESALVKAVTEGRVDMVVSLLNYGADSAAFDNGGQSPVDLAMEALIARKQKNNRQRIIHRVSTRDDNPSTLETVNTAIETVSNVAGLFKTILGG